MGHINSRRIVAAFILLSLSGCAGQLPSSDGLSGLPAPTETPSAMQDEWPGKVEIGTVEAAGMLAESWNPFFNKSRSLASLLEQSLRREGLLALTDDDGAFLLNATLTDMRVLVFKGGWMDTTVRSTVIYRLSPSTADGDPFSVEIVAEHTYSAPLGAANRVQRVDRAVIGSLAENVRMFLDHIGRSDQDV